jgi:ankyrin repeat protein
MDVTVVCTSFLAPFADSDDMDVYQVGFNTMVERLRTHLRAEVTVSRFQEGAARDYLHDLVDISPNHAIPGWTMLMQAVYSSNPTETIMWILQQLKPDIECRTHSGMTALIIAARHGKWNVVAALLRAGADVNGRSNDGRTPLHYAVESKNGDDNGCKTIEVLLSAGADVNALGSDVLCSPLYLACLTHSSLDGSSKELEILLLLNNGADPNLKAADTTSPLHQLCFTDNLDIQVVNMLIRSGADPHAVERIDGFIPMHMAFDDDNAIEILSEMDVYGMIDFSFPDSTGNTFLHNFDGDGIKFRFILDKGCKPDIPNMEGETPLHCLSRYADPPFQAHSTWAALLLLRAGVNMKTRNYAGQTARQIAYIAENFNVVELLDREVCQPRHRFPLLECTPLKICEIDFCN